VETKEAMDEGGTEGFWRIHGATTAVEVLLVDILADAVPVDVLDVLLVDNTLLGVDRLADAGL
jgi:glycerol-3-phosphate acyltransferase PlsY